MLIRDPYLASDIKPRAYSSYQPKPQQFGYQNKQNKFTDANLNLNKSTSKDPQYAIQAYEKQLKSLSQAYRTQQQALKKFSNYQSINQQYHEAMKQRNYQLNAKLNDVAYQKCLISKRHEQQMLKTSYDKDLILKKYQEQNQQILRLKRSVSQLLEQKARLQSEIDHLMFLMQKDNHQGSLQIKQQLIRMQNMERTLRTIIDTKDQQIVQLRHRLKVYEDENRRLNDLNKTLTISRPQKIDNISKIQNIDSNIKSFNKQNLDMNKKDDILLSQLKQQKQINQQLLTEINAMKKKLFQDYNPKIKEKVQTEQQSKETVLKLGQNLSQIRLTLNNKLYQIYNKSVIQGQKQKKNSLLIFIENYKKENFHQFSNQINDYAKIRQQLKNVHKITKDTELKTNIQTLIPIKLNSRSHSKDSQWVLSTIQFAKNERGDQQAKKGSPQVANNSLLYLFRLLTIKHRIKNPIQGKLLMLQNDVNNQLLHSIVKALQSLLQAS